MTFAGQWTACRNSSLSLNDNSLVSDLTSIDITLSNGQIVNIAELRFPIQFFIPRNNDTIAGLQNQLVRKGCDQVLAPANLTVAEAVASLECSFWDPTYGNWSTRGCVTNGLTADHRSINCSCGHLTEFAILHRESQIEQQMSECDAVIESSALGHWVYAIFLVLYSCVSIFSGTQLVRVVRSTGWTKYYLMVAEHTLIMLAAASRAFNMLAFYELYQFLSLGFMTISSGVPHLFTSWIFSFVIFAW